VSFADVTSVPAEHLYTPAGHRRRFLRRLLRRPIAVVAILVILIIYITGILAPVIAPYGFNEVDFDSRFSGSTSEHLLGTDRLGRDVLSRLIWSAQTTVIISVATLVTGGLAIGVTLGLTAGYLGGRVDSLIMRTGDAFSSLPTILMLLIINATLRGRVDDLFHDIESLTGVGGLVKAGVANYFLVFGALSLFGWVGIARIIRSQTLALRDAEYVRAARSMGASLPRIVFVHLLPNTSNLLIVAVTLGLGTVAAAEVGLSFLGIGIHGPHASFGLMVSDYAVLSMIRTHFSLILYPLIVIASLLFAFNLLGDALTDILSPRRR
jgi:peptide/nickel transport system permease protein